MGDQQKQKLQSLSDEYQKIQGDLQQSIQARQKLEAQQQENKGVQKEFKSISDSSTIYKLVGPVLLKQDRNEASMAVDGRLEYIGKEISRVEDHIKNYQELGEKKKMEVFQLQTEMQEQGQAQVAA